MWIVKYKPKSLKEFVNQKEAVQRFLSWIRKWKPGSKALLFYGPPGTGKTCLVEAFAYESNYEFIQLNASDWRSRIQIEQVLGQTIKTQPLIKKGKIILIDEIDGLAGREDIGGAGAILKIVQTTRFPIVLTANDPFNPKLRKIRESCELVEFKKLSVYDIERRLAFICKQEGIKFEKEALREIARRSEGDLRSAINDLEVVARGKKEIKRDDLSVLGFRERERAIFEALKILFKTKSIMAAKLVFMNVDRDLDELLWWVEENIPKEYERREEIAKAFERLAKADLFRAFIKNRQYWKLSKYFNDLMTAGVALAKKEMYRKFTKYSYPTLLRTLARTKTEREIEKEKLKEWAKRLHCSTKKVKSEFLPYLKLD